MNAKLSSVSDKSMNLTYNACGSRFSNKIAEIILAASDSTTAHEVCHREPHAGVVVSGANTPEIHAFVRYCR